MSQAVQLFRSLPVHSSLTEVFPAMTVERVRALEFLIFETFAQVARRDFDLCVISNGQGQACRSSKAVVLQSLVLLRNSLAQLHFPSAWNMVRAIRICTTPARPLVIPQLSAAPCTNDFVVVGRSHYMTPVPLPKPSLMETFSSMIWTDPLQAYKDAYTRLAKSSCVYRTLGPAWIQENVRTYQKNGVYQVNRIHKQLVKDFDRCDIRLNGELVPLETLVKRVYESPKTLANTFLIHLQQQSVSNITSIIQKQLYLDFMETHSDQLFPPGQRTDHSNAIKTILQIKKEVLKGNLPKILYSLEKKAKALKALDFFNPLFLMETGHKGFFDLPFLKTREDLRDALTFLCSLPDEPVLKKALAEDFVPSKVPPMSIRIYGDLETATVNVHQIFSLRVKGENGDPEVFRYVEGHCIFDLRNDQVQYAFKYY